MDKALHRHDISDRSWSPISPHLPDKQGDWGGIATRYAKRADSFLSIVQIRCMIYWLRVGCGPGNV